MQGCMCWTTTCSTPPDRLAHLNQSLSHAQKCGRLTIVGQVARNHKQSLKQLASAKICPSPPPGHRAQQNLPAHSSRRFPARPAQPVGRPSPEWFTAYSAASDATLSADAMTASSARGRSAPNNGGPTQHSGKQCAVCCAPHFKFYNRRSQCSFQLERPRPHGPLPVQLSDVSAA